MGFQSYSFLVNGMRVEARYRLETVQEVFLPLLRRLTVLQREKGKRLIIFLAAAPGVGKTTLSLFWQALSQQTEGIEPLQAIGIDGFHHHQDYLLSHTGVVYGKEVQLVEVKGAPETYDLDKLRAKLALLCTEREVLWPIYDRQSLHDVVEDQVKVAGDIVLLEGNWLLLQDPGWRDLKQFCDLSVYIDAQESLLRDRLIQRKINGGSTPEQAAAFYERADGKNVRRVCAHSQPADVTFTLLPDGDYRLK